MEMRALSIEKDEGLQEILIKEALDAYETLAIDVPKEDIMNSVLCIYSDAFFESAHEALYDFEIALAELESRALFFKSYTHLDNREKEYIDSLVYGVESEDLILYADELYFTEERLMEIWGKKQLFFFYSYSNPFNPLETYYIEVNPPLQEVW